MNIKDAKQEIIRTIMAYTAKNEQGIYAIPTMRQRPLLLIGPPGVGKTAVMEQAANACKVGFVSYSMTHHTRQSAIGLPFIEHRTFHGQECAVTEYTMSEIIASVCRCMEESGVKEGLLFLDEINCVSETLAPAILQFLQTKTFGSHRLPEGWILAAAGNPVEYNKSVREFDIATLDRLKYIQIEADYDAWRPYALESAIHPAILSYLDIRPEQFYILKQTYTDKSFATARGWEDLSCLLKEYEALKYPVTSDLIKQYLHVEDLAQDFSCFYHLFQARKSALPVPAMMNGDPSAVAVCRKVLLYAPFREKLNLIHLMLAHLGNQFQCYAEKAVYLKLFDSMLDRLERFRKLQKYSSLAEAVPPFLEKERSVLTILQKHALSSEQDIIRTQQMLFSFQKLSYQYQTASPKGIKETDARLFQEARQKQEEILCRTAAKLLSMLTYSIQFLEPTEGPEFTLFLSSLYENSLALDFFRKHPCDACEKQKGRLDFRAREAELKKKLRQAADELHFKQEQ